jgi:hypothetical protein
VDGRIFFAGFKGIYVFDGSLPRYIGQAIEGSWRSINKSQFTAVVGVVNERDNEVRFSIATGSSTSNNLTLVYDYVREVWSLDDGYAPSYWANLPDNLPLQPVYGRADGRVLQINTDTFLDDSGAITAYFKTKPTDFGDLARRRKVRQVLAVVDKSTVAGAAIQFRSGYDLNTVGNLDDIPIIQAGAALWDSAIFDVDSFADEGQFIIRHYQTGFGRLYQLELRNDQASVPMKVSKLEALVKGDADE